MSSATHWGMSLFCAVLASLLVNGCVSVDHKTERLQRVVDVRGVNGNEYRVWISVPDANPPAAGFRAIYLLDANDYYGPISERAADDTVIAAVGYANASPEEIVRARLRDFTTTVPLDSLLENVRQLRPLTGGVHDFLRVLIEDVRPAVLVVAPIDQSREVLAGHSLSGLAVFHAAFDEPATFDAYIAASPSIWWGDRAILAEEEAFRVRLQQIHQPICIFVFVGGLEQTAAPGANEQIALRLARYRMIDNARELVRSLDDTSENLRISFELLPNLGHAETAIPALQRGINETRGCATS